MEKSARNQEEQRYKLVDYEKVAATHVKSKSQAWDCESSLYDSFELKSFKLQLDSAIIASSISTRSQSMPHLRDRRAADPDPLPLPPLPTQPLSKKPSKISRSFRKLLRSVFRGTTSSSSSNSKPSYLSSLLMCRAQEQPYVDHFYVIDKSSVLYTIPEAPEMDYAGLSPELNSFTRKAGSSERFTASSIGISCV